MTLIEAWLVDGPNDGDTLQVDLDATTVTVHDQLYVRRPRGEDLTVHACGQHPAYTFAAWFDHEGSVR